MKQTIDILNKKISIFSSIKDLEPLTITLFNILNRFRKGYYENHIRKVRNSLRYNSHEIFRDRKKRLPLVSFSGRFFLSKRKNQIFGYTNLMVLDFDHLENSTNDIKQTLYNDPHLLAIWTSPSGLGLKALVMLKYDKEFEEKDSWIVHEHEAFPAVRDYFKQKYNLNIDLTGADITRLCFISYYPDLYLKKEFLEFNISHRLSAAEMDLIRQKYYKKHKRNFYKKSK